MKTIRIRKHIESETLNIPELREVMGKDVEIIVQEDTKATNAAALSLTDLADDQGKKALPFEKLLGKFTSDDFSGFEDALNDWRRQDIELQREKDKRDTQES
jgi:hypothetical protein